MTYFNAGYMAGALGLFLCHYVLALSSYLWGYLGDYSPPFGGGVRGRGQLVVRLCCSFFLFISCAYKYSINILSFLIFFI